MKARFLIFPCLFLLSLITLACDGRSSAVRNVPDVDPPQVVVTTPAQDDYIVHPNSAAVFIFDEPVDRDSPDGSASVVCDGDEVEINLEFDETSLTVTPFDPMPASANCTVTLAGVRDTAGNVMKNPFVLTFTTASPSTGTYRPPPLYVLYPAENATGVFPERTIQVRFDDDLNPQTVNSGSFSVSNSQGPVGGDLLVSENTIIFTANPPLAYGEEYTVTLSDTITTLTGDHLQDDYFWSFKTLILIGEDVILSSNQANYPLVHSDAFGNVLLVWGEGGGEDYHNASIRWSERTAGSDWTAPTTLVDTADNPVIKHMFAGNGKGDRFLVLHQIPGWWSLRYDGSEGLWGLPIPLDDIPGYCSENDTCLVSEVSLTVGEDGSAMLVFMEISQASRTGYAKVKRYDPELGWQPVEDLEQVSYSSAFNGKISCAVGEAGNAFAIWVNKPDLNSPYPPEIKTSFFTIQTGWSEPEVVPGTFTIDTIFFSETTFDPAGRPWFFWDKGDLVSGAYRDPSAWKVIEAPGTGRFGGVFFDGSGTAILFIQDDTPSRIRVVSYDPAHEWGTQYYLSAYGRLFGLLGEPKRRTVALYSHDGYLWRMEYTTEGLWSEPQAVAPVNSGINHTSNMTMLPDGYVVFGTVKYSGEYPNERWELVATEFY
jgi:hypothetical protein